MCYDIIKMLWPDINLEESVDHHRTVQNELWKAYQCHFTMKQVTKHVNKIIRLERKERLREEAERKRREAAEQRRMLLIAQLQDIADMRARNLHTQYFGHYDVWSQAVYPNNNQADCQTCLAAFREG